jgi:hypothetical protein
LCCWVGEVATIVISKKIKINLHLTHHCLSYFTLGG